MQPKQGDPKVPDYKTVSNRVMKWDSKCDIGFKDKFAVHASLRSILCSYDVADFVSQFGKMKMESENYVFTISGFGRKICL
jgi:hypothetical protein